EARAFADQLQRMRQAWWQVLPLVPPAGGNSPYTSAAAFAGSPLLVDPRPLVAEGLLTQDELDAARRPATDRVDFGDVFAPKPALLRRAFERFRAGRATPALRSAVAAHAAAEASWLDDYALYAALHEKHDRRAWTDWSPELRDRDPHALKSARARLAGDV